jgi:ketosteroid isomerase-like protein
MSQTMTSAPDRYFRAISSLDYLSCFAANPELQDPYGSRPYQGEEGLGRFFNGLERTWSRISMQPSGYYVSGDRVAVPWSAEGVSHQGKTARFSGVNVFSLNEDGLISRIEGYWDFKAMVAQIS